MSGSGLEAIPDVQKWWEDPPVCPGVVLRPFWMFGSGRETIPDVRKLSGDPLKVFKSLPDVWGWREALLDVCQFSGGCPGCPGVTPGCPAVVGRLCRMSGNG